VIVITAFIVVLICCARRLPSAQKTRGILVKPNLNKSDEENKEVKESKKGDSEKEVEVTEKNV
jgi:hypothetical protein